jgi:hypothetical protein
VLLCTGMTKFCCALVIDLPRRICEQKAKRGTFRFQGQATYCLEFTALLYYYPCVMIKSGAWFGKMAQALNSLSYNYIAGVNSSDRGGTHYSTAAQGAVHNQYDEILLKQTV